MGTKDLREAFNTAADGFFTCSVALLDYERVDGVEWQRLTFSGSAADGSAFSTQSGLIPAKSNVTQAARDTAVALIDKGKTAP